MWRELQLCQETANFSASRNPKRAMTLKSAFEDLSRTTLKAVLGFLGKLEYLAGLRAHQDEYAHWGFEKVYGQQTASKTLNTAHQEAASAVLAMPISTLLEDVENSCQTIGEDPSEYVAKLTQKGKELLPKNPGPGSARHFNSVLRALSGLVRIREQN